MTENKSLCLTCEKSLWCPTWAEVKCKHFGKRIYNYPNMTKCNYYKKRDKNFKEPACQREDCLKNDLLAEERGEEE